MAARHDPVGAAVDEERRAHDARRAVDRAPPVGHGKRAKRVRDTERQPREQRGDVTRHLAHARERRDERKRLHKTDWLNHRHD